MRDIRLEYVGTSFDFDNQPWLDQSEDDSGEEPLFTLITVKATTPDRDTLALDLVCACVGKVPPDTCNLLSQVYQIVQTPTVDPGQPVCVVAHWTGDSIIPPVVR